MQNKIVLAAIKHIAALGDIEDVKIDPVSGFFIAWLKVDENRFAATTVVDQGRIAALFLLPNDALSFRTLDEAPSGSQMVSVTKAEIAAATTDIFTSINDYFPLGGGL